MKKEYFSPEIDIVKLRTEMIMAGIRDSITEDDTSYIDDGNDPGEGEIIIDP